VIADAESVISCVLYGPDRRTQITPETRQVLFTVYAPPGIGEPAVHDHLQDIQANVLLVAPQADVELLEVYGTK
jgi:DNA/RNA-binding domain of Phe-tRNA-synthetase-like protein